MSAGPVVSGRVTQPGRVSDEEFEALKAAGLVVEVRGFDARWALVLERRAHEAEVLREHRRTCPECRLPLPWVFTKKGLRAETQAEVELVTCQPVQPEGHQTKKETKR